MNKLTFILIIFVFTIGCTTPATALPARTAAVSLDLNINLEGAPLIEQPFSLQVGAAGEGINAGDVGLKVPKGIELLGQKAIGGEYQKEFVLKAEQPGLSELKIDITGSRSAQIPVFVFLARPQGGKLQSPFELSASITPHPAVGKTVHLQAWAMALVASPNTTLEAHLPEGVTLAGGSISASRNLAENETLELSADLQVERQGEFPVEIRVLSKSSEDLFWGRNLTFYVQVGTSLGNTITEFSEGDLNATNKGQIERGTPLPPPAGPTQPGKPSSLVPPDSKLVPVGSGERPESNPSPSGEMRTEIKVNQADTPADVDTAKPTQTPDGVKQPAPDPALGPSGPATDLKPETLIPKAPQSPDSIGWNTLMLEDFEGAFPNGLWSAFDNDGTTNGEYYWDDDDYKPHNGYWSAWAANGGANGLDPEAYYYADNMDSWMVYGPFDLSDASDAELWFSYWNQSESDYDGFSWMASGDGANYSGWEVSGDSAGWQFVNFDLSGFDGDSSVWIAFNFKSDFSNVDDGPFVDDVTLWKYIPPGPLTVYGTFQYRDKSLVDQSVPYARVEFYDLDTDGEDYLGDVHADADGYYSFTFTNDDLDEGGGVDLIIRMYTTDDYSVNVRDGSASNNLFFVQTPTEYDLVNGSWDEGTWIVTDANIRMAWYIYDKISDEAWNFLVNNVGWDNNNNLQVRWNPTSTDGTYYNGSYVALVAGDRWDEDVFLHEYGHFVMDHAYATYPSTPNCNPHHWGGHSSLGCAWSEGWATFLQGAIQNSPAYVDTEDQTINYSLEPPSAWADHPEDEGAVGAGLWDIFDSAAEGHDTLTNGINGASNNGIWNIFFNYDPVNIQGFWNSWGSAGNGFCPQVWSVFNHVAINYDTSAPGSPPGLYSPTHSTGSWSNSNGLSISYSEPSDGCGSGIAGYSYVWDASPATTPDTIQDTTSTSLSFLMVEGTWYFHVRAADKANNRGGASHLGPFYIDLSAPNNPGSVWSTSHTINTWSTDPTVDVSWSGANDSRSGVYGYSYEWSTSSTTIPDTTLDTTGTNATSPSFSDSSSLYFHIRTRDVAGNWNSGAIHTGPFKIDRTNPSAPSSANPNCTASSGAWQNTCNDPNFSWSGASDSGSGVSGYYTYWGSDPAGTSANFSGSASYNPGPVSNPSTTYLRVQTRDNLGWLSSWITLYTFRYDATPPSNPGVASPSHSLSVWSTDGTVDVTWSGASDGGGSGVAGYSLEWTSSASTLPDATVDTSGSTNTSSMLADGNHWYFHIRTRDNVGNWHGSSTHYGPFYIDKTAPVSAVYGSTPVIAGESYQIAWSGTDAGAGLTTYDVQFRQGAGGAWLDWLSGTTATTAVFGPAAPVTPVLGETYYFRCRARDALGNIETYPSNGDISVYVTLLHYMYLPNIRR